MESINNHLNTFSKNERLCSEKSIQELFKTGNSGFFFPIKYLINKEDSDEAKVQILITVPKRLFKHAVQRNKYKRFIREAYRKNKHNLAKLAIDKKLNISIAFIYVIKDNTDFIQIETAIKRALKKTVEELSNHQ